MTTEEILFVVRLECGCGIDEMADANEGIAYDAKCIACMMVHEEGVTDKEPLARLFETSRSNIYAYIKVTDRKLSTWPWMKGYDGAFKQLYLRCIKRLMYFEDRPELNITFIDLKGGLI